LYGAITATRRGASVGTGIIVDQVSVVADLTMADYAIAANRTGTIAAASVGFVIVTIVTGLIAFFSGA
jgi:hypothetical protein